MIQLFRGLKKDLLALWNTLPSAAMAWVTDTDKEELWVGTGVAGKNKLIWAAPKTSAFSIYVATTALGGRAASTGATGLAIVEARNPTGTAASKLIDSAVTGGFTSAAHLNKTVFNATTGAWAKITAVDSASQCSLSANIITSTGHQYVIADALDNLADAWAAVPTIFYADVTIRMCNGTFSGAANLVGKFPNGNYSVTIRGDAATTTITGQMDFGQALTISTVTFSGNRLNFNYGANVTWSDCPLTNATVYAYAGSQATWDNNDGTTSLYAYDGCSHLIKNTSGITVMNDPQGLRTINTTLTIGYTMYVHATYGSDSLGDGLALHSGTTTSASANKLINTAENFTAANCIRSDSFGYIVYNVTKDTWARVTAVDSATQLTLSADIMASGDAYVISNAFITVQAAVNAIPGLYNCNTTIKVSNATYNENVTIQGKNASGSYTLYMYGTKTAVTNGTASAGSATTLTSALNRTLNQDQGKLLRILSGTGAGQDRLILSNTAGPNTVYTVEHFGTTPDNTSVFDVVDWGTVISNGFQVLNGQKSVDASLLAITKGSGIGVTVNPQSSLTLRSSKVYSCSSHGVYSANGSAVTLNSCYLLSNGGSGFVVVTTSQGAMNDCWSKSNTGNGLNVTSACRGQISYCTMDSNGGHGVYITNICIGYFFNTNTVINNTGWGVLSDGGGLGNGASTCTYSGNGSGTYSPTSTIAGGNS